MIDSKLTEALAEIAVLKNTIAEKDEEIKRLKEALEKANTPLWPQVHFPE